MYNSNMKNYNYGFTLAEVLITLAIIGVVAAMTIPTLVSKYQEKVTVNRLIKVYATLTHAFEMAQVENGSISEWGLNTTYTGKKDDDGNDIYDYSSKSIVSSYIRPFLKVSRICQANEICINKPLVALSGTKLSDPKPITEESAKLQDMFFLSDGTFINIGWHDGNAGVGDILVVLPEGKERVYGKNTFYFKYTSNGVRPEGTPDENVSPAVTFDACAPDKEGRGCTAWVIYNKNMDYLHCRDELSWDGKHKCSD